MSDVLQNGQALAACQQVANQMAVAVENALIVDEIEARTNKLQQEKVYLEEEVRTDHNFEEIIVAEITSAPVPSRRRPRKVVERRSDEGQIK